MAGGRGEIDPRRLAALHPDIPRPAEADVKIQLAGAGSLPQRERDRFNARRVVNPTVGPEPVRPPT